MRLAADGTAATGLTITNFDLQYTRSGVAPVAKVDATALAATDSVHADNKAIEIDATDQPGLYRVDWPDAAFAAGVREVVLSVKCATCFTEHLRVEIDAEVNVVEWAGTDVVAGAIPAAAADAAGGLVISDAGGLDADADVANQLAIFWTTPATLVDLIWDEVLTGATHNVNNSSGKRLRQLASFVLSSDTAQAGGNDTITLAAGESSTDGIYVGTGITIDTGTGAGQSRYIIGYDGTTKVATVARPWTTNPASDSTYNIIADNQIDYVQMGLAAAGGATSITLDANASATDDIYKNQCVRVFGGTGKYQIRRITAYNGTTKVATVDRAWETNPDSTSYYAVLGVNNVTLAAEILAAVTDDDTKIDGSALNTASANYFNPTAALTEAYAALGVAPSIVELLFEIRAMLTEGSVVSTTFTAKKIDGSTTAATYTLDSATTPTSITRAS